MILLTNELHGRQIGWSEKVEDDRLYSTRK